MGRWARFGIGELVKGDRHADHRLDSVGSEDSGQVDRQAPVALPASQVRRGVGNTLLLTVAEAATELRVSGRTVERMVREGVLLAVRIGKRGDQRIRRADLEKFVGRLKTTRDAGAEAWR